MTDAALEGFHRLSEDERALRRKQVRVLILTGLGLNCEAETEAGFRLAGASPEQIHLLDILENRDDIRGIVLVAPEDPVNILCCHESLLPCEPCRERTLGPFPPESIHRTWIPL